MNSEAIRHSRLGSDHSIAQDICALAREMLPKDFRADRVGLYLVTHDAGIDAAVNFWALAIEQSPRFASPANFPWTLSNAIAGEVARNISITGPNHTLVGEDDAIEQARAQIACDFARNVVDTALLVHVQACSDQTTVRVIEPDSTTRQPKVKTALLAAEQEKPHSATR